MDPILPKRNTRHRDLLLEPKRTGTEHLPTGLTLGTGGQLVPAHNTLSQPSRKGTNKFKKHLLAIIQKTC